MTKHVFDAAENCGFSHLFFPRRTQTASLYRTTCTKNQKRRGAAVVELALILPVFFAVVLGIVEFGRALMVGQMVTNSAREGCRQAILNGSSNADVEQWIDNFLSTSLNIDASAVTVAFTVTPAAGNPNPGNEVGNAQAGDLCLVNVDVPFDQVSYLPGNFLSGRILTGQSAMRHE